MSRLTMVFLLTLGVFSFACSGNSDNPPAGANSSQIDNSGQNSASVDSENDDSELVCPEPYMNKNNTPAKAALEEACYFARYIKQIDFQPSQVETSEETSATAKVRVVGYSESCERFCPGEIQIRYEAFLTGDEWDVKGVGSVSEYIEESDERAAARAGELETLVDQVVLSVSPLPVELDYNGRFSTTITTETPIEGLSYRLLVDFPTGETDVEFWSRSRSYSGVEEEHSQVVEEGYTPKIQYHPNYDWSGEFATIKAYKVIIGQNGVEVRGEWVYLSK